MTTMSALSTLQHIHHSYQFMHEFYLVSSERILLIPQTHKINGKKVNKETLTTCPYTMPPSSYSSEDICKEINDKANMLNLQ
jgi:hypothetical protein